MEVEHLSCVMYDLPYAAHYLCAQRYMSEVIIMQQSGDCHSSSEELCTWLESELMHSYAQSDPGRPKNPSR